MFPTLPVRCVLLACLVLGGAGCEREPELTPPVVAARLSEAERQHLGLVLNETRGGFAYQIPRDWTVTEWADQAYSVAVGPRLAGYVSNIRVSREPAPSNFDYYLAEARKELMKQPENTGVEEDSAFVTAAGVTGRRWITHSFQGGTRLWHAYYLFPTITDAKLVVMVSAAQADELRMRFVADACLKTLVIR